MDREKMIARHYLDTGILGAYETTEVVWDEVVNGKCVPCFEDAMVVFDTGQTRTDRVMDIEGRRFHVCSVFPADTETTPTDKLLALIDTELEKDTRTA